MYSSQMPTTLFLDKKENKEVKRDSSLRRFHTLDV